MKKIRLLVTGSGVRMGFSTIAEGPCNFVGNEYFDRERRANIAAFLKNSFDFRMEDAVFPKTFHSSHVEVVSKHNPVWGAVAGDAVVTGERGLMLTMPFADCPTVILHDHINHVLALIHSGWKPLGAGIIQKTIERMRTEFNCYHGHLTAYVGPGICKTHYEVGRDVAEKVMGIVFPVGYDASKAKWHCDLPHEIEKRLLAEGVQKNSIIHSGECTYHEGGGERYFSWRREQSNPLNGGIVVAVMN